MKRGWMAWILAWALAVSAAGAGAAALVPTDDLARLAQDARERRAPILLAFMQQHCPYCAKARRYLEPVAASGWGGKAILREIDVDSTAALRDFEGRPTTAREFARRHGVRVVPTLLVFDADGRVIADPVRGIAVEDFYAATIDRALETGYAAVNRR